MTISRASRRPIQPKLRSMPLRKTPSALYIQMHQLANEKESLQEELVRVCDRQQQIVNRLAWIMNSVTAESDKFTNMVDG